MDLIFETISGSKLYGTDGFDSDTDLKGIFMLPTLEDVHPVRSMSIIDGVDKEHISIHEYLRLLKDGQTMALDMLFAMSHPTCVQFNTPFWKYLHSNHNRLVTKNSNAFLGYCRKQASKYGVKGSRVKAIMTLVAFLRRFESEVTFKEMRLNDVYPLVEEGEWVTRYVEPVNGEPMLNVCARKFEGRCKLWYLIERLQQILDGYGKRAKDAEVNDGIDWKAVSHAFRVAYEFKELLLTKEIQFPLENAGFLKSIKDGRLNYLKDGVSQMLDSVMLEVEELLLSSDLPEEIDLEFFNDTVKDYYNTNKWR